MFSLILSLIPIVLVLWIFRYYVVSLSYYLSVRFERRKIDFQLLSSLRDDLVHERKKKMAGLEMILSSWEKGEEIQPRYEYLEELLGQLKNLVLEQRKNLMSVTRDIFLWGELWNMLRRIEKTSSKKREKSDVPRLRKDLALFQNVIEEVAEDAIKKFSFTLNEVVKESVKIVRIEKSKPKNIEIAEQLDDVGNTIRFSYDKFKDWQRVLTNLIRNAVEAVEAKKSGASGLGLVAADFSLRGGDENLWVRVSTRESEKEGGQAGMPDPPGISAPVSVIIEDSGVGMDESTKFSFYKKGFTSGKEGGLGLGVTEESVQLIDRYGNWQVKSKKGIGTRITINIDREKSKKAELILPAPKPFFRTKLAFGLSFFLLALIALALLFAFHKYSRFWEDWNPASVKLINENAILVETKDSRVLWHQNFPQKIFESGLAVGDIDGDGKNEVLIGTQSGFKETGYLHCFSFDAKELWRFALGAEGVFQVPSNRYSCGRIIVRDLNSDGEMEILVGGVNKPWFPYQIALLDRRGQLQTSYWHSGSVSLILCEDIDDDGIPEIVFGGVNNRLQYSAVLGILEHGQIWDQSPPYRDTVLTKAKEKIYVKFPFIRGLGGENDRYSNVVAFIYAGVENGSDVYHVAVHDPRAFRREYHLDKELTHVKRLIIHPDSRLLWEKLKKEGVLDYDLSPEVVESWKEIEVWKDGVKVK
jgi:signal transduction histidine kinase